MPLVQHQGDARMEAWPRRQHTLQCKWPLLCANMTRHSVPTEARTDRPRDAMRSMCASNSATTMGTPQVRRGAVAAAPFVSACACMLIATLTMKQSCDTYYSVITVGGSACAYGVEGIKDPMDLEMDNGTTGLLQMVKSRVQCSGRQ